MRRKEERSKQGHTNYKAKQHSTPKAATFPKKNELPRVGFEPTCAMYVLLFQTFVSQTVQIIAGKKRPVYINRVLLRMSAEFVRTHKLIFIGSQCVPKQCVWCLYCVCEDEM